MGLGVYRYDTETQRWTALGGKAEDTRPGTYFDVLLWENSGMAPEGWYQGLMNNLAFDKQNRLHVAASFNSDFAFTGNNRIIYAFSNDGGLKWSKVGGGKIAKLPIRALDGLANQADIVNNATAEPFFDSKTKVVADKNGKPGVINDTQLYSWNGTNWVKKDNLLLANTADLDVQGQLILTATSSSRLMRAETLDSRPSGYDFSGYNLYESVDAYSIRTTGVVYGVGINTKTNIQSILKTTYTPAPLPCGWHSQDIGATLPIYDGRSGFSQGKFIVNDYCVSIDNPHDSFHYVYKPMYGDGAIIARVEANTSVSTNGRAGLMMRETLAFNARDVFALIAPGKTSAIFGYRSAIGEHTANVWTAGVTGPTFIKLERAGNVFTGSISTDGKTWTQTGKTTLVLPNVIYVGLASASYHKQGMQKTTFDLVMSPSLKNKTLSAELNSCAKG